VTGGGFCARLLWCDSMLLLFCVSSEIVSHYNIAFVKKLIGLPADKSISFSFQWMDLKKMFTNSLLKQQTAWSYEFLIFLFILFCIRTKTGFHLDELRWLLVWQSKFDPNCGCTRNFLFCFFLSSTSS